MKTNVNRMYESSAQKSGMKVKNSAKRGRSKILSLLLAFSMVASLFVLPQIEASAAPAYGSGTAADPYQIWTFEEFENIKYNLTAHYVLKANITKAGSSHTSIGATSSAPFKGVFDGGGHQIYFTGYSNNGLFYYCNGATIKNVKVKFDNIDDDGSAKYTGGIAAYATGGTDIIRCEVECYGNSYSGAYGLSTVSGYITNGSSSGGYVGGIVGYMDNASVNFCSVDANIRTIWGGAVHGGGIAGYSYTSTVRNCYFTGKLESKTSLSNIGYTGGLIGYLDTYTTTDYNFVRAKWVGAATQPQVGYYNGHVFGNREMSTYMSESDNYCNVTQQGTGLTSGKYPLCSGTVGSFNNDPGGNWYSGYLPTNVTSGLSNKSNFSGFDFDNIWDISSNGPTLKTGVLGTDDYNDGKSDKPYEISSAEQLIQLATSVNTGNSYEGKYFKLTADVGFCTGDSFVPIGTPNNPFKGNFDGGGHCISFDTFSPVSSDGKYAGVFGYTEDATIHDLWVWSGYIRDDAWPQYAGNIVAYARYTSIYNCYATGDTTYSGGSSLCVKRSHNYAGGIVGYLHRGSVSNCYNTTEIYRSNDNIVGGIAGGIEGATISDCYNTGNITNYGYYSDGAGGTAGGIVGEAISLYRVANATVERCYNTSRGEDDLIAGSMIVGKQVNGGTMGVYCYITDCIWNGAGSPIKDLTGVTVSGSSYLSISSFKTQSNFSGWNFSSTWYMSSSQSRPVLRAIPETKEITITAPTAISNLKYTGSAQQLVNSGSGTGATFYYSVDGNNWYTSAANTNVKKTAIGTYTIFYKVVPTNSYEYRYTRGVYGVTATISKGDPTLNAPTTNTSTLSYDGAAKQLLSAGASASNTNNAPTIYYYASTDSTVPAAATVKAANITDYTKVTATNPGTYYIYYYTPGNNYWNATSVKKHSSTKTINKGTPAFTNGTFVSSPTYNGTTYYRKWAVGQFNSNTFTYDGTAKQLLSVAPALNNTNNAPTIYYYASTSTTTPTAATVKAANITNVTNVKATDAGDWNVYFYADGNTYWNSSEVGRIKEYYYTTSSTTTWAAQQTTKTIARATNDEWIGPNKVTIIIGKTGSIAQTTKGGNTSISYALNPGAPSDIATVNASTGVVTANKVGTTTFKATASSPSTNYTAPGPKTIDVEVVSTYPDKPTFKTPVMGDQSITLSWTAPLFTGGIQIQGYEIHRKKTTDTEWSYLTTLNSAMLTSYTDNDVELGVSYDYRVFAKNANGLSTEGAVVTGIKPYTTTKGSVPINGLWRYKNSLGFGWGAPSDNGGDEPSKYKVSVYEDGQTTPAWTYDYTANNFMEIGTDQVLKEGTKYSIHIVPVNGAGDGEETVIDDVYTLTKASEPRGFETEATASDKITVSWSEPEFYGYCDDITGYVISYRKQGTNAWTVISENRYDCERWFRVDLDEDDEYFEYGPRYAETITGLTTGAVYEFKVSAANDAYSNGGTETEILEQICASVPVAPVISGELITKDQGALVEEVSTSNNMGMPVEEYVFYARESGTDDEFFEFTTVEADDEVLIDEYVYGDDLENGLTYDICAAAVNGIGEGEMSEYKTVTVGLPSKVENVRIAQQAYKVMHITFDPADGNGSDIVGYELTIDTTVKGKKQDTIKVTTKKASYDFQTDGNAYGGDEVSVKVVALNKISTTYTGKGESSDAASIRVNAPGIPEITRLQTDTDGVSLSWTEPEANETAIQRYTVYLEDEDTETVTKFQTEQWSGALDMEIAKSETVDTENYKYPFEDGHTYYVSVTATNGSGEGEKSEVSEFTFAAPEKPENVVAEAADGKLTVSWNKPSSNGGYEIIGYNIYLNGSNEPEMMVEWDEYVNDDVVTYQLMTTDYHKGDDAEPEAYPSLGERQDNLNAFTVVINNLSNGSDYTAEVRAINEMGEGPSSSNEEPVTPSTKASAPVDLTAEGASGTSIDVSWRRPINNGGSPITKYIVRAYAVSEKNYETGKYETIEANLNDGVRVADGYAEVTGTSCTLTGLTAGYGYEVKVCAYTGAGEGEVAVSKDIVKTHTVPSKPVITSVESAVGNDAVLPVTVRWTAPKDNGNSPIIGYDVYASGFKMNTEMISPDAFDPDSDSDELIYTFRDAYVQNGEEHTITVIAYNAVDQFAGTESDAMKIRVGTIPAPRDVKVTMDYASGQMQIAWSDKHYSSDAKALIDRYLVYVNDKNVTSSTQTNATYKGIFGTDYTVEVAAISKAGIEGSKSIPVTVKLGTLPQVTGVTARAGDGKAEIAWNPVEFNNSRNDPKFEASQYKVYVDGEVKATVDSSAELKATVAGLEGGKEYEVTVTASNYYGEGVKSAPVKVTPWSNPDAPKVSNITPAFGKFSFTFEDGNGNGANITSHEVYLDGSDQPVAADKLVYNGNTVTVKDVTNGGSGHTFYMLAVNANGLKSAVPEIPYKVLVGIPAAPANLTATAGIESAQIAFNKSADIEGYPVESYNVYVNDDTEPVAEITADGSDVYEELIDDLTNGIAYTFTVSAVNEFGESERSNAVSVKPGTPDAPVVVTPVKAAGSKLMVEWSVPEANAAPITKYGVYVNGVQTFTVDGKKTSATIDDLENGVGYEIMISAYNYIGEGALSTPVQGIPGGAPGMVTDVDAKLTYNKQDKCGVVLTWKAPEDNGGFNVKYRVEGEGTGVGVVEDNTIAITNLDPGTKYTWDITAFSEEAGDSDTFTTAEIMTMTKSDAPIMRGVDSYNSAFYVKWEAPKNDGGSEINKYKIYLKPSDGIGQELVWETSSIPTANANGVMEAKVDSKDADEENGLDLVIGKEYEISVTAVNAVSELTGESERSASMLSKINGALVITKPGAPENVKVTKGDSQLTITWNKPSNTGGAEIEYYVIYSGVSEDKMGLLATTKDGDTRSYTDTGLTNGVERFYKVYAHNSVDDGPFSETVSGTPSSASIPSAPTWPKFNNEEPGTSAYETAASGNNITFTWNESIGDAEAGEISYEVWINNVKEADIQDTSYTYAVPMSDPTGKLYSVTIRAYNKDGGEAWSDPILARNTWNIRKNDAYNYPEIYTDGIFAYIDSNYDGLVDEGGTASPPRNVRAAQSPDCAKAVITWNEPADTGSSDIDYYTVVFENINDSEDRQTQIVRVENGLQPATYSLLSNNSMEETEYSCEFDIEYKQLYMATVTAHNDAGFGKAASTALQTFPEIPSEFEANVVKGDNNQINIEFTWKLIMEPQYHSIIINTKENRIDNADIIEVDTDETTGYTTYKYVLENVKGNTAYNYKIVSWFEDAKGNMSGGETSFVNVLIAERAGEPTNLAVVKSDVQDGEADVVKLTWKAPANAAIVSIDHYNVYVDDELYTGNVLVNGEWTDVIPANALEAEIEGIANDSLIKIVAVNADDEEGEMSEAVAYVAPEEGEPDIAAPAQPTNAEYELTVDENNNIVNESGNATVSWKIGAVSDEHPNRATSFEIYMGSDDTVIDTINAVDGQDDYSWTLTETVEANKSYLVRVIPVYDGVAGTALRIVINVPANTYPAPEKPVIHAALNADRTAIVVEWDMADGETYDLTVNDTVIENVTSPYEYTDITDDVTIYTFMLTAVRDYGDESTTADSDPKTVNTNGPGVVDKPNAPKIYDSMSFVDDANGVYKTKIYWNEPEKIKDNNGNVIERGEIAKYIVTVDGEEFEVAANTLSYEIEFDGYADTKTVTVRAVKLDGANTVESDESDEWVATPKCNIQNNNTKYDNDDLTNLDNRDKNGDGIIDLVEPEIEIEIVVPGVADTELNVAIVNSNGVTVADTTVTTDENADGTMAVPESNLSGTETYSIVISAPGYTSFTLTGVTLADLENMNLDDVEMYAGDLDGDGSINAFDFRKVKDNVGMNNAGILDGDLDGSGSVTAFDSRKLKDNIGKENISRPFNH